ncbi:MAG TPA: hypothetical protein VF508_11335 [Pyrinomonadaceae bacterium]|jgi:hypothetical protein
MKRHNDRLRLDAAATLLATLLLSGHFAGHALGRGVAPGAPQATAVAECEGDACSQVTSTFDEAKQQYKARNNSPDRWARVTASNMASSASVCLGPGKEAYLALKTLVGPYRAVYAAARCGEDDAAGPPASSK